MMATHEVRDAIPLGDAFGRRHKVTKKDKSYYLWTLQNEAFPKNLCVLVPSANGIPLGVA